MESVKPLTKSTPSRKRASMVSSKRKGEQNDSERIAHIAVSAYYKAQARGFQPGHELDDWLAAEAEERQ